jgi:G:T-mismatch repair DNA endonuclease (very short patch repair protein)
MQLDLAVEFFELRHVGPIALAPLSFRDYYDEKIARNCEKVMQNHPVE